MDKGKKRQRDLKDLKAAPRECRARSSAGQPLVAFRSIPFARYLRTKDHISEYAVDFDAKKIRDWEAYEIRFNDDGTISLLNAHFLWLSALPHGGIEGGRKELGSYEKFELIIHGAFNRSSLDVSLRGCHGMHLSCDEEYHAYVNGWKITPREHFQMELVDSYDEGEWYDLLVEKLPEKILGGVIDGLITKGNAALLALI